MPPPLPEKPAITMVYKSLRSAGPRRFRPGDTLGRTDGPLCPPPSPMTKTALGSPPHRRPRRPADQSRRVWARFWRGGGTPMPARATKAPAAWHIPSNMTTGEVRGGAGKPNAPTALWHNAKPRRGEPAGPVFKSQPLEGRRNDGLSARAELDSVGVGYRVCGRSDDLHLGAATARLSSPHRSDCAGHRHGRCKDKNAFTKSCLASLLASSLSDWHSNYSTHGRNEKAQARAPSIEGDETPSRPLGRPTVLNATSARLRALGPHSMPRGRHGLESTRATIGQRRTKTAVPTGT